MGCLGDTPERDGKVQVARGKYVGGFTSHQLRTFSDIFHPTLDNNFTYMLLLLNKSSFPKTIKCIFAKTSK